mmetsp:Transcript_21167/g.42706  ORF Transcript_21167/g.42706 Transcript_21167/m.42706 type:complete len:518 (-) Transcript_21167:31-1584(-)|eukprot:CAMPEP_0183292382 /NCGR_PEP_ID=MMETSP0160_2-20130417/1457_1 /TAXON_ID=2839 ORGANISM="Odontella Sinensis, Strain Grunow 1884" /NCGR_SAMPLE_ID=MMETSP0160_2 /ASSEMBLY_ACC=CAM_ASM_000250 /LENGTH=517 /DNA_ID=CAMNT_0025453325 /DNA_START=46 /DNA_END=1599 /DNA_ORIENTATION=-
MAEEDEKAEVEDRTEAQDTPQTCEGGDNAETEDCGSAEAQDTPPFDDAASNKNDAGPFGSIDVSLRSRSKHDKASAKESRADWTKAMMLVKTKIAVPQSVIGKVKLENKIGTRSSMLDSDDDMKVVALATQRALRDFGKMQAAEKSSVDLVQGGLVAENGDGIQVEIGAGLEGSFPSSDVVSFAEEKEEESRYCVHQPSFRCNKICDDEFSKVRAAFGYSERQYHAVFGLQERRKESNFYVISSKDASGKSSSFFFLSPDQRFILKSCTAKDVKTLVKIIKDYCAYVESCKGERKSSTATGAKKTESETLLPRYLGLYGLEFDDPDVPDVVVVAMTNFFGGAYAINRKFDLKGSTYQRAASEKERAKKSPVFKDLDWMEEGRRLHFPTREEMQAVRNQLQKDTKFLSDMGLIDYSLLVGIHEIDKSNLQEYEKPEALRVISVRSGNDTITYFGIVDVLTPYGKKKAAETIFMGNLVCCRDISCQRPPVYQRRFMKFCDEELLACDEKDVKDGGKEKG